MRFKPSSPKEMPLHVHRAFYNDGRQPEHTMSRRVNGFEVFTDMQFSTVKATTWAMRSVMGKGVRVWRAEHR